MNGITLLWAATCMYSASLDDHQPQTPSHSQAKELKADYLE